MYTENLIYYLSNKEKISLHQNLFWKIQYFVNKNKLLVKLIKETVLPNRKDFESYGLNGRKYFELHFKKDICISHLCRIITEEKNIS